MVTTRVDPLVYDTRWLVRSYEIDQNGHVRGELNTAPGPGTTATKSSFAVLLADAARQYLRPA